VAVSVAAIVAVHAQQSVLPSTAFTANKKTAAKLTAVIVIDKYQ